MDAPLTADELATLRDITTPTVANAIETFEIRGREIGFMDTSVRAVVVGDQPMVGYACTAKIRASRRPDAGLTATRKQMWEHILSVPAPRVVVIEDIDERPVGSFWGEVQANIHKALGCIGTVTNGGVRDLDEVRALGFHAFAGSVMVSHAWVHVVEVGCPVTVGGTTVKPGELLHGDQHGVAVIPLEVARELPSAARKVEERERRIIELCQSPDFSLDKLGELYG